MKRKGMQGLILKWSLSTRPLTPGFEKKETGRDGTFISYAKGIVRDRTTGLEWIAGFDVDIDWSVARNWVEELTTKEGEWRMPTRKELKTLYKQGAGINNMTPLFKSSGFSIWSGEQNDASTVWKFVFFGGAAANKAVPVDVNRCTFTGAFAVRSGRK